MSTEEGGDNAYLSVLNVTTCTHGVNVAQSALFSRDVVWMWMTKGVRYRDMFEIRVLIYTAIQGSFIG